MSNLAFYITRFLSGGLLAVLLCAGQVSHAHGPTPHGSGANAQGTPAPAPAQQDEAPDPLANRFGGKFSLIDHSGQRVTNETYRGRYMLIYFGFTNCVDLCPVDLAVMVQALQLTAKATAEKIQPLFITVDPDVDTPAILAKYVANLHPNLIGLTGTVAEVEATARAYRVQRHKILHTSSNGHPYIIDHGTLMFLMGPDGKFVTLFPHNSTPEKIAENLNRYVK